MQRDLCERSVKNAAFLTFRGKPSILFSNVFKEDSKMDFMNYSYHVNFNFGEIIWYLIGAVGMWRYYQKMGRQGWEGVVPFYNIYVLFEELYGSGWRCLLLLIPFYNIYLIFKLYIDLAHAFNQSTGFGVGLTLLNPIFSLLLGFGSAVYGDGSAAVYGDDAISRELDHIAGKVSGTDRGASDDGMTASDAERKLRELDQLRRDGILSDEEFEQKKREILSRF